MCHLPIEVSNTENIVRIIFSPHHIKNGKIKGAAFRSRVGSDEVSVIRQTYMGSNFCKEKALSLHRSTISEYQGLAFIKANKIREIGSTVEDSRDVYCGHADIAHGVVLEPNEPADSDMNRIITERLRTLVNSTTYYPDPNPSGSSWTGPDF